MTQRRSMMDMSSLMTKMNDMNKKNSYNDDSDLYWTATQDKAGNGSAIIRFLPGKDLTQLPFVRLYSHGFQGDSGRWWIDNCRTTLEGETCPVCEANFKLYATKLESDKEIARPRNRRTTFIANVLIVKDPGNPENEGKVKLFKFGKKIYDKVTDAMSPQFEDEAPINPFDPLNGANFKLKIRKVDGFTNYDKSEFADASELFDGDDDKIAEVLEQVFDVTTLIAPDKFKSYEDQERRLNQVLGTAPSSGTRTSKPVPTTDDDTGVSTPAPAAKSEPKANATTTLDDDDDDALDYFKKLASED